MKALISWIIYVGEMEGRLTQVSLLIFTGLLAKQNDPQKDTLLHLLASRLLAPLHLQAASYPIAVDQRAQV